MVSTPKIHAQKQRLPGLESEMTPTPDVIRESYRGSGKLEGKVALITGGDSGIGRSTAVHFAREGENVAFTYLAEEKSDADETVRMIEAEGQKALAIEADLRERATCDAVIQQTLDTFGGLNTLVNNAGTQQINEDMTTLSDEQWKTTFETNVDSLFYMSRAALPHLGEDDTIINNASINAYIGPQSLIDYSATKGAIISFTRALSNQVVGRGVRVNAVAPGPVWTPLQPATIGAYDPEKLEGFGEITPMGRAGQPFELGPCFVFLAALDSSFISGQTLHPNGGTVVNG
ncbi:SDR family oxidoreductase [Larsenimonas salina]|uniref:SDR family oxidoreductase n=1 Tax=Larsenimonas salina TaxID=1295565 RepID=UPI0020745ADA|nr:SDR family oxidoreductase [Larsenimonas salina]MCM5704513.1 SDR family oxidoreductase [Larsenimonas salina]